MIKNLSKNKVDEFIREIEVYGFCHAKQLIKPSHKKKLLLMVKKCHKESVMDTNMFKGLPKRDSKDLRVYNLPNKNKIFIDLITNNQIEKILKPLINDRYYRFLPDKVPNYILNSFSARSSGYALDLHIDSQIPFQGNFPISILILFVLEDMNEKNGATVVVPGSHQSGKYTNRDLKNVKIIEAKAGDVLFVDSRTWHGTKENRTKKSRWLINALFSQWWLKQQIDLVKSIPPKIFEKLSNKQKQVLGFCSIPPKSELDRINTKCGYNFLKKFSKE